MKRIAAYFNIVISIFLLWLLLSRIDMHSLKNLYVSIELKWVGLAFIVMVFAILIKAYRWQILIYTQNIHLDFWKSAYLNLVGIFFNYFMPSLTGGDIIKGWMLGKENKKWLEVYSSLIVDRVVGLVALSSLVITSFILFGNKVADTSSRPLLFIALVIPTILFTALLTKPFWAPVAVKWLSGKDFWTKIQKVVKVSLNYLHWRKSMLLAFMLSIAVQFSDVFICYFLSKALNMSVPIIFFFLFIPLTTLAAMMPISINGLGVRETTYVLLFGPLNVKPELAIALSLSYYFVNLSLGLIGGILYALLSLFKGDPLFNPNLTATMPNSPDLVETQSAGYPNVQ